MQQNKVFSWRGPADTEYIKMDLFMLIQKLPICRVALLSDKN